MHHPRNGLAISNSRMKFSTIVPTLLGLSATASAALTLDLNDKGTSRDHARPPSFSSGAC